MVEFCEAQRQPVKHDKVLDADLSELLLLGRLAENELVERSPLFIQVSKLSNLARGQGGCLVSAKVKSCTSTLTGASRTGSPFFPKPGFFSCTTTCIDYCHRCHHYCQNRPTFPNNLRFNILPGLHVKLPDEEEVFASAGNKLNLTQDLTFRIKFSLA